MTWIDPVVLEGQWVRLEPLEWRHEPALIALQPDEEVYRYLPVPLDTPETIHSWIEHALSARQSAPTCPLRPWNAVPGLWWEAPAATIFDRRTAR